MAFPLPSASRARVELLAASFVVLFQELALIRWLPGQVRVLAYFPNLVLLSAFLGLGLGALSVRRFSLPGAWLPGLLLLQATAVAASRIAFTHEGTNENFWLLYEDLGPQATVVKGLHLPIIGFFVLNAAAFMPLGNTVSARLEMLRQEGRPLVGYVWDLAGSLTGVAAFSVLSALGTRPLVWFLVMWLGSLVFQARTPRALLTWGAAGLASLGLVAVSDHADIHSPYYALTVHEKDGMVFVNTNGSLHQVAMDLRQGTTVTDERQQRVREGYHAAYRMLGRAPRKVLILGAGSGNDVAVALDEGAQAVHAVEIDPEILEIGRKQHPARPYADPRTTTFNTDARTHLNNTRERYDLIVFGTLDSMTRLSALSNVRLDNFVYTEDCMRAAAARLTPDGGLVLMFMVGNEFIRDHINTMLTSALARPPLVYVGFHHLFNTVFLTGPAFWKDQPAPAFTPPGPEAVFPTDDWPYLYLASPGVSTFYLSIIAILLLLAAGAVMLVSPELRSDLGGGRVDLEMFLLGGGFMLLETRLVTSMNLIWGATWLTSAVVFGSILLVVLLGTILSHVRPPNRWVAMGGVLASLLATWAIPESLLLVDGTVLRLALSTLYVGAPMLFASLCFASVFSRRPAADIAFGWNLLGAVAGGLLEFFSMLTGLKAMQLLALLLYLGLFFIWVRQREPAPVQAGV